MEYRDIDIIEEIKEYCEKLKKEAINNVAIEESSGDMTKQIQSMAGQIAYRKILNKIKELEIEELIRK